MVFLLSVIPMKSFPTIAFLLAVAFAYGCASPSSSPSARVFCRQHPAEARLYETMEPVSVAFMDHLAEEQSGTISAIIQGVRQRQDNSKKLSEYLTHIEEVNRCSDRRNDPEWTRFKDRLRPGDSVHFFKYRQGEYSDFGLLVLRRAEIAYRSVWGWTISSPSPATNEPPVGMTFDRL